LVNKLPIESDVVNPHIVVFVGTRPELIKLESTISELRRAQRVKTSVVFSGQHPDLLPYAAATLGLSADYSLTPLPTGRNLVVLVSRTIEEFGALVSQIGGTCVVIQGDTATCLAGAIVAELLAVPLVHVEAGVRSNRRNDPFPEEAIRRMISTIADLHLCFAERTSANLLREGVEPSSVVVVPHPLIERVSRSPQAGGPVLPTRFILATLHRRERRSRRLSSFLEIVRQNPSADFVFVWHPTLGEERGDLREIMVEAGVLVIGPLPADVFINVAQRAQVVLTDSAGVAEEVQLLGRPLVAFRTSIEYRIDDLQWHPMLVTEDASAATLFINEWLQADYLECHTHPAISLSGPAIATQIYNLTIKNA
jgi:UDP-N-acetylglucosamine 2-epimerase (non-hydrolysing)